MSRYLRFTLILIVVVLLGALTACGADQNPLATPTKTPVAFVAANPGGPTATPAPFMTPTPEEMIAVGPDNYPPDVNPLTGLKVSDPSVLERRPIEVVVVNSQPHFCRPQAGLSYADIVFEYFTEGLITRYTALFWTEAPELVGPVRSCRPINAELTLIYDAIWACSGSSIGTKEQFLAPSPNVRWLVNAEWFGEPYLRRVSDENILAVEDPPSEYTMYAAPNSIWEWADEKGHNGRPNVEGLAFHSQPPEGGAVATHVKVRYADGFEYTWAYDEASGTYLRFDELQKDGIYTDKLTGEQLGFENVVVVAATQSYTDYAEDNISFAKAVVQEIWGEGSLTLFRDGMMYEGKWRRPTSEDMLTYHDLNGNVLPLKPGQTWVQVLDLNPDRLTVEP